MTEAIKDYQNISLRSDDDRRLYLSDGMLNREVFVRRLFPETHPDSYLSLTDAEGKEIALVQSARQLDESSQRALGEYLDFMDRGIQVRRVEKIEEESELRVYHVLTHVGPRSFVTKNDEWPRGRAQGGFQVVDLYGDLYEFPALAELDETSRKRLWSLVDGDVKTAAK